MAHVGETSQTTSVNDNDVPLPTLWQEGPHQHLQCGSTTHLCEHFNKRDFIIMFTHYNGSRAFIDTFNINAYNATTCTTFAKLGGYINSLDIEAY